jgi:hypothetical protein
VTPTTMARDWEKVNAALDDVIAFADIDKAIDRRDTESIPADAGLARQVLLDAPRLRAEADRRATQVRELRALAAEALRAVAEERAEARDERRQLWRRVLALRVRLTLLRVSSVGGTAWWLLMALPRSFRWIGRAVSSPFRTRTEKPFDDDDDGPSRRRVR